MQVTSPLLLAEGTTFIEIALLIFFSVFLLIVAYVFMHRRGHFDSASRIPLDDDRVVTPRDAKANADRSTNKELNHVA